jgi:hypothetical protein
MASCLIHARKRCRGGARDISQGVYERTVVFELHLLRLGRGAWQRRYKVRLIKSYVAEFNRVSERASREPREVILDVNMTVESARRRIV